MVRPILVCVIMCAGFACRRDTAQPSEVVLIKPWEAVSPSFHGCQGACGAHGEEASAVAQPKARVGDLTYCPVSGAAFQVSESTPSHQVGDHTYYFCCPSCAAHFSEHRGEVLAARGLTN